MRKKSPTITVKFFSFWGWGLPSLDQLILPSYPKPPSATYSQDSQRGRLSLSSLRGR